MKAQTAKSFLTIASDAFGVSPSTAGVIDRALAVGGLRQLGKGRSWPALTRDEALVFLLACMVTQTNTRAAEDTLPWLRLSTPMHRAARPDGVAQRLAEALPQGHGDPAPDHLRLPKALLGTCALLETGALAAEDIALRLDLAQQIAILTLGTAPKGILTFSPATPMPPLHASAIRRSTAITGAALEVIVRNIPCDPDE